MATTSKNVVIIGASYVGLAAAKEIASIIPKSHRILLIEPHSHFHHLFAFPRFAVLPKHEHKAFIPYSGAFASAPDPARHLVIRARVTSVHPKEVVLDREWQGSNLLPFDYLVVASGTRLPAPGTMQSDEKLASIDYFKKYQQGVLNAKSIVIVGGGAVSVQMATDVKELYPEKNVTLVHSRDKVMPIFHDALHNLIKTRFDELGVNLVTGSRAVIPENGFPTDGTLTEIKLQNGSVLKADLVIPATGQVANNQFLTSLETKSTESIINPKNGFIRVKPTLQLQDPKYANIFAVGDIADTGAQKAARPAAGHAQILAQNLEDMIEGKEPTHGITVAPPAIHLTLGLTKNVIFRNPDPSEGVAEPMVKLKDDGEADMGMERTWERRGVKVTGPQDFHL